MLGQIIAGGGQLAHQFIHRHELGTIAAFQRGHPRVELFPLVAEPIHLLVEAFGATVERAIAAEHVVQQIVQPLRESVGQRNLTAFAGASAQHFDRDPCCAAAGSGELAAGTGCFTSADGALNILAWGAAGSAGTEA